MTDYTMFYLAIIGIVVGGVFGYSLRAVKESLAQHNSESVQQ